MTRSQLLAFLILTVEILAEVSWKSVPNQHGFVILFEAPKPRDVFVESFEIVWRIDFPDQVRSQGPFRTILYLNNVEAHRANVSGDCRISIRMSDLGHNQTMEAHVLLESYEVKPFFLAEAAVEFSLGTVVPAPPLPTFVEATAHLPDGYITVQLAPGVRPIEPMVSFQIEGLMLERHSEFDEMSIFAVGRDYDAISSRLNSSTLVEAMRLVAMMLPQMSLRSKVVRASLPTSQCAHTTDRPTFFFRINLHNGFYHLVHDNMFPLSMYLGENTDIQLVFWERRFAIETWVVDILLAFSRAFSDHPPLFHEDLTSGHCFRRVHFGYVSSRLSHTAMPPFSARVLRRLAITPDPYSHWRFLDPNATFLHTDAVDVPLATVPCPSPSHRRLTIPTRTTTRRLVNEEELADMALQAGYCVRRLEVERLGFVEQLRVIAATDVFAGVFGAAFTHILFMRPRAVVLMLLPLRLSNFVDVYPRLANAMGLYCVQYWNPEPHGHLPNYDLIGELTDWVSRDELASFTFSENDYHRCRYDGYWCFNFADTWLDPPVLRHLLSLALADDATSQTSSKPPPLCQLLGREG